MSQLKRTPKRAPEQAPKLDLITQKWAWRMHSLPAEAMIEALDTPPTAPLASFRLALGWGLVCWRFAKKRMLPITNLPTYLKQLRGVVRSVCTAFQNKPLTKISGLRGPLWTHINAQHKQPPLLRLWLKPRLLTNAVQLLSFKNKQPSNLEDLTEHVGTAQTIVAASSTTIAAALGFSRLYRKSFFIQQCLFKHIRRYLVALDISRWDVSLLGISPRFRSCWRALTRPSMEVYLHFLTEEVIADLGVSRNSIQKVGGLAQWLRIATEDVNWLETPTYTSVEGAITQLQKELITQIAHRLQTHQSWQRYTFEWARLYILKSRQHGFLPARRARSIKRRQVKRLIRRAKYRFWPS